MKKITRIIFYDLFLEDNFGNTFDKSECDGNCDMSSKGI